MKNLSYFLIAAAMMGIMSCGNNSANSSNSTEAAVDSNKKELEAKDSTELKPDAEYAVMAANGGMLEVELGKLAQTKATSPKVVEFAKMMVEDHSKANKELMGIAGAKFITLPAILDNKKQKDYDDFAKMDKKDFDKAYTDYMVKDHKEDIDEFKKEAQDGKDAELKAFAAKHVPILEHHLQAAQAASDAVKK
jgi:putative membrane protein